VSSQPKSFLTPEEYLEHERRADHKSEYLHGEVFARAGGSPRHAWIIANLVGELRQQKFQHYRALPSLVEYLTVGQDEPHIEHWARQPENRWLLAEFSGLVQSISLQSIGCVLALAEIYDKIEWAEEQLRTGS
jgi:Uma2 family endonuclease